MKLRTCGEDDDACCGIQLIADSSVVAETSKARQICKQNEV